MKILITNDDGICAEGLRRLVKWAGKLGDVTVFAPRVEQSAKSHAIEIHKPFGVLPDYVDGSVDAWAVDSTPADCVRIAYHAMHQRFDLVLSGINRGLNIGQDIIYSGTVSAAMEAAAQNMPAIAISTEPGAFDTAIEHLNSVWAYITQHDLLKKCILWNVNIPANTTGVIRLTRQGGPYFGDEYGHLREEGQYVPNGVCIYEHRPESGFDTDAVLTERHISITPLTIDRTAAVYAELAHLNDT